MARAVIWGCIGLFITAVMRCPLPVTVLVTVVTAVVGCWDFHIGEYVIGVAALAAGFAAIHRTHLTVLGMVSVLAPLTVMVAGAIVFLATNPWRARRFKQIYEDAGERLRGEQASPVRVTAETVQAPVPERMVVEHHHYQHIAPAPVPYAVPAEAGRQRLRIASVPPASGQLIPFLIPGKEVSAMATDNPAKGSPREGEKADKILGRGSNPKNK